jgi:uncharacterized Rmd1/YagE family protein
VNLQGVGDIPELYWDEPVLEKYFTGLMSALEVKSRVHDLNQKITHAQEVHGAQLCFALPRVRLDQPLTALIDLYSPF